MWPSMVWMLAAISTNAGWQTPAEQSDFTRTPRYEETMAWFQRLDAASENAQMSQFGISPQGRALQSVVLASDGEFSPALAKASRKPIVLIQAAIHPLDVAHQPADGILRNLRLKPVPWLEEDTLSRHQTLPERTDGGLPEIAALCVLLGCPSSNQRDAQVGDL